MNLDLNRVIFYSIDFSLSSLSKYFKIPNFIKAIHQSYTQSYGINYTATFALVPKLNTVRILISLVVNLNWERHQYDIKNAFLTRELEEEIYMQIPLGYENPMNKDKVCRLKRGMYSLKQSPKAWFGKFTKVIKLLGYRQSNGDHTLFF